MPTSLYLVQSSKSIHSYRDDLPPKEKSSEDEKVVSGLIKTQKLKVCKLSFYFNSWLNLNVSTTQNSFISYGFIICLLCFSPRNTPTLSTLSQLNKKKTATSFTYQ
jgi:hypothetical protein